MTLKSMSLIILSAIYTSSWWMCFYCGFMVGDDKTPGHQFPLFLIPIVMTIGVVIAIIANTDWNE